MPQCPNCKGIEKYFQVGMNPFKSQRFLDKAYEKKYIPSPTQSGYQKK
jgi:hypothetical protein